MCSFESINQGLLANQQENVVDQSGLIYALSTLTGLKELSSIDFSLINLDVLQELQSNVHEMLIHNDHNDYETETELNPNHEYAKLLGIQEIIYEFGKQEKRRVPSSFRFL